MRVDRLRNSVDGRIEGLAGVKMLELLPHNCSFSAAPMRNEGDINSTNSTNGQDQSDSAAGSWYPQCLTLVAHAQPPRYNLPCGPIPPVPVTDLNSSNGGLEESFVAARCREAEITPMPASLASVGRVPLIGEKQTIFPIPPTLSSRGVLEMQSAPHAYGDAAFALLVQRERAAARALRSGGVSQDIEASRGLAVSVVPVRVNPSFTAIDVTVNEDAGSQVLKFATNVLSGNPYASQEALFEYKWDIKSVRCTDQEGNPAAESTLFTRPLFPGNRSMATYLLNDNSAYGAVRFQWAPDQSGICTITVTLYDSQFAGRRWESDPQTFTVRARAVNDPPHILIASAQTIEQGAGRVVLPRFVTCLSWAPDIRPPECDVPLPANTPSRNYSQALCLPSPSASAAQPFGDCGDLVSAGDRTTAVDIVGTQTVVQRGPYCLPGHEDQGPCWFSVRLVGVQQVAGTEPWPAEADRVLVDAPGSLRNVSLETDSLVVEMDPDQFGLFCITLAFSDLGGTAAGGIDTSVRRLWLTVRQRVLPPVISLPTIATQLDISQLAPALEETLEESIASGSAAGASSPGSGAGSSTTSSSDASSEGQADGAQEEVDAEALARERFLADLQDLPLGNLSALNLIVVEMKHPLLQSYPDFMQDITNGPAQQAATNTLTSSIVELSSSHLFAGGSEDLSRAFPTGRPNGDASCTGCPVLGADGRPGSLSFTLAPFRFGIASMLVRLESVRNLRGNISTAVSTYKLDLVVLPVNDPPRANVTDFLGLAQGSSYVKIPFFVTNISVGPENEVWQRPVFHVYSNTDTPRLLTGLPSIDAQGTLSLSLHPGVHGRVSMRIMLSDTGGNAYGGQNMSRAFPVEAEVKVFPRPRIVSVSPCLGVARGGWSVTIRGNYFGSAYSTDGSLVGPVGAQVGSDVEVQVGGQPCQNTRFISDTLLVCDVPPGGMRRWVQVKVGGGRSYNREGRLLSDWSGRLGNYLPGIVHAHVYFAGAAGAAGAAPSPWNPWPAAPADGGGHAAHGNASNCTANATGNCSVQESSAPPLGTTPLPAGGNATANATNTSQGGDSVRRAPGGAWLDGGGQGGYLAISPAMDCLESDTLTSSLASARANCPLGVWDGDERKVPATASPMPTLAAHVLSRSVRAMTVFGSHLVLGGSFLGHTSTDLDYLVLWDGAKVQPLGGGLDGTVYAVLTFRSRLVVGGSFSQLYQVRCRIPLTLF